MTRCKLNNTTSRNPLPATFWSSEPVFVCPIFRGASPLKYLHAVESTRLHTRPLRMADTRALLELYSDPHAMRFRGSGALQGRDDAIMLVRKAVWEDDLIQHKRVALTLRCGELAGTLLLKTGKLAPRSCEVGFSFGPKFWGKGLATETLAMVEHHLRTTTDVQTVTAWCVKANVASVKVFSNAGFAVHEQDTNPGSLLLTKDLH